MLKKSFNFVTSEKWELLFAASINLKKITGSGKNNAVCHFCALYAREGCT